MRELEAILAHRNHIVAVDLAGDEVNFPAAMFVEHFRKVRDAGLHVTVHAGEAVGPESVWSAIRDLGAERIGHGFRAIEDPELVDYLAGNGVGLECCPTSNLHISAIADYASHPIKQLADRGVRFCLNTDDPGISNIDIAHEYEVSAPAIGLSPEQILQSQRDALDLAQRAGINGLLQQSIEKLLCLAAVSRHAVRKRVHPAHPRDPLRCPAFRFGQFAQRTIRITLLDEHRSQERPRVRKPRFNVQRITQLRNGTVELPTVVEELPKIRVDDHREGIQFECDSVLTLGLLEPPCEHVENCEPMMSCGVVRPQADRLPELALGLLQIELVV